MDSVTRRRRVVLLAAPGDATNATFRALSARFDVAGVILEQPFARRTLLRRRARRIGWPRAMDQVLFVTVASPLLRWSARHRVAALQAILGAHEAIPASVVTPVPSVNDAATIAALGRLAPDCVVVAGTRIIGAPVLDAARTPFINLHAGITPRYRGVHGAYWALAEGRPGSAGVTVHLVDRGIDTGGILAQGRIVTTRSDSFATLPYLQLIAGIPLLVDAVEAYLDGRTASIASIDASASKLWYHPGALEYLVRRIRRGVR